MAELGRTVFTIGLVLVVVGGAAWGLSRFGFRGLPGDIVYRGERVQFYAPIATMLVVSAVLTALIWGWQWLTRR